jgi:hypothetical protein
MPIDLKSVIENTKEIYISDNSLDTLLNFERVIDELDVYAFSNWKTGELVAGPEYEKYWITCTFMWPENLMPDPRGGERLLDYGCEIKYQKSELSYPTSVTKPEDYKPGTKFSKSQTVPVWLVEITMPKQLMTDIQQGSLELENEKLDMEDIDQAYETGEDEEASGEGGDETQDQNEEGMAPEEQNANQF